MPLHQWYIPRGLYTPEDKANIAAAITEMYHRDVPVPIAKLLIEVQFFELDKENRFVSGEPSDNQVQIRISHVARHSPTKELKDIALDLYHNAIKPYTQDRGVTWEIQVADEDPFFWRICGLIPPYATQHKEGEDLWYRTNKPLSY